LISLYELNQVDSQYFANPKSLGETGTF